MAERICDQRFYKEAIYGRRLTIAEFAESVGTLELDINRIKGVVLVAGHGPAFPERVFICSPKSEFTQLDPKVRLLICCDPDLSTSPASSLENRMITLLEGQSPSAEKGRACFYFLMLQRVLRHLKPKSLDAIAFFRIPDMQEQIEHGLLPLVKKIMKQGGIFMGSGEFESLEEAERLLGMIFEILSIQRLYPFSSGYLFSNHIGFVVEAR